MAIKLFGIAQSRAHRPLWAIEETGVDYEHVQTTFGKDSKSEEYLAVNPNGRVPALMDGDLKLFESMAINLYLTKKYAPDLFPQDIEGEAKANQWSVWAISEIEPLQMQMVMQKVFTPKEKRDQSVIDAATKGLDRPLNVINSALEESQYLLGDSFTVADLNVAGVMLLLDNMKFDYSGYPKVSEWLTRCYERPALAKAKSL